MHISKGEAKLMSIACQLSFRSLRLSGISIALPNLTDALFVRATINRL